jgi:hypothetical protein
MYLREERGKEHTNKLKQLGHRMMRGVAETAMIHGGAVNCQTPAGLINVFFWVFGGAGVMCKSMGHRACATAFLFFSFLVGFGDATMCTPWGRNRRSTLKGTVLRVDGERQNWTEHDGGQPVEERWIPYDDVCILKTNQSNPTIKDPIKLNETKQNQMPTCGELYGKPSLYDACFTATTFGPFHSFS